MNQLYVPDTALVVPQQNNLEDPLRREFLKESFTGLKAIVLGVPLIAAGCAAMIPKPDFDFQEGDLHTINYTEKGKKYTVPDLTGKWRVKIFGIDEIVEITQDNDRFIGTKTIGDTSVTGNQNLGKGAVTISGKVNGNLVECQTYWNSGKTTYFASKLSKKVDSFQCKGVETRTYTRIE
jgi:hypothetical protein